ncbi:APC family permease [Propioniciclava coleopterorum]|uniref:APC family permease n=2 Tax=Propioniciclava coleopterorum TaxID=2714937 RepID=A0A6G7YA83_9ACTN|nr:APC family permease [Propioniciclava coleopterorum]
MIGAGVFVVWAPAARAAGAWLFAGLVLAAVVAWCNATSSAQLAARYPSAGGTYLYGREELGPWWGFLAGWGFVVGKTASAAAMALTAVTYLVPDGWWQRPVAALAVVALAGVNYRGITRTAALTRVLLAAVGAVLVAVVAATWLGGAPGALARLEPAPATPAGVLQAGGLIFFAFAGYARIATLGEEVRDPRRAIPRAIWIALGVVVVLYAFVGIGTVGTLGPDAVAASPAPVLAAVEASPAPWLAPAVRVGAGLAALGALLGLIAGIGRTALAMARHGDLPRPLAAVHPRFGVPHVAEVAVGAAVAGLVLVADLREVIGFSSFGVLVYYAVANLAAWRQREGRLAPRAVQGLGLALCLLLVAALPVASVAAGAAVFAVGLAGRLLVRRRPPR